MKLLRAAVGSVWLRVAVTLGLLGLVLSEIDWDAVRTGLLEGDPWWFAAAVVAIVAALVVGAVRWRALLKIAGIDLSPGQVGRIYAISTFSQTFLPTTVGGDVARSLLVTRNGPVLARTASTVVVDRAGGLAGLLAVAWVAVATGSGPLPRHAAAGLTWATLMVGLGGAVVVVLLLRRPPWFMRLIPARALETARNAGRVARDVVCNPGALVVLMATSVVFQALVSFQIWALARCLGDHPSFGAAAVTLTLVTIATLIPLSIGGFGIREGSYVVLLASIGIGATNATLISLGSVVVLLIASLPGAVLLAMNGMRPALE
ncbi:MAG TPA: lysylphosphatidylglycerol synthase transmembrane domain-containing protein [Baekduia sp.]